MKNYFENFVGLSKEIAPDGKNIKLVGFTSVRDGVDRPVALRKNRKEIRKELHEVRPMDEDQTKVPFTCTGILTHANTPRSWKIRNS